jgi:hypothetical protein
MAQQLEKLLSVQSCMRKCLPSSRSSDPVAINLPLLQQDQPAAEGAHLVEGLIQIRCIVKLLQHANHIS